MIQCKSKRGIGSTVGSSTESESEGSEEFFFRFQSSENKVNGIGSGSGIISQSKNSLPVPFKLRARKKKVAALEEKLAEAVRQFPILYDKSCRDFKDNSKKRLAWEDVATQVGLQIGMYCSSEYSNSKSSNLSLSPGSAILNVYK